ncbi:MAG: toll/interleukin-1 receptor domain-containing protein, partial [Alistipes sp.]|nr:toll/interleukin-1 receptor domain-containing protein [Alistipes sp.]
MKYDVFISYSRKDTTIADKICAALDRAEITYFIDRQGIGGGFEFPKILAENIIESRIFLLIASENAYASKFTTNEIIFAFNKKPKNSILPYIIDKSELPLELQFTFAGINWRTIENHPIEPTLVNDLLNMLGRKRVVNTATTSSTPQVSATDAYNKGNDYYVGRNGKTKSYEEAVKWYRKAAEMGHATSQYNLGYCYENGHGVTKDYSEAVKWYRKAAEQGHANAQCSLGYCYNCGQGVTKDLIEAVKWYRKAAEQGLARAQCNLGVCYKRGEGVTKDETEAVKWYRKAAEQGHARAQYNLGYCYDCGQGVTKDEAEAVKWYRKAAEQGHANAQCNLGYCYDCGQ